MNDYCAPMVAFAVAEFVMLEPQSDERWPRLTNCDDIADGAGEPRFVLLVFVGLLSVYYHLSIEIIRPDVRLHQYSWGLYALGSQGHPSFLAGFYRYFRGLSILQIGGNTQMSSKKAASKRTRAMQRE